jgi:GcrA cell cycle regulator
MIAGENDWSDPEIDELKRLWGDGLSASQVARALATGRSRNAVIGKAHRLGLMGRAKADKNPCPHVPKAPRIPKVSRRPVEPSDRQKTIAAQAAIAHPEPARLENGELIGTEDLGDKHCRWPHGDVGAPGFHHCGLPKIKDSSYCDFHDRRQRQPSQKVAAKAVAARRKAVANAKSQANFARMGMG